MLSPLRLLVVALGFSSLCLASAKDVRSSDGKFSCEFGGGSIKVYLDKNATRMDGQESDERSFEVRFNRIEETSPSGDRVQEASEYANEDMWTGPIATTLNGLPTELVQIVDNGVMIDGRQSAAVLSIQAYLFSVSGEVIQAGEVLSVPKNSLKLTFGMLNWPFQSMSNNLTFGLELILDTESSGSEEEQSEIDDGRQQRLDWGGAALDIAANAVIDGILVPIQATPSRDGEKTFIAFSFPAFNSSLVYDPTVSIGNTKSAAAAAINGASGMILALFAAAVATMQL